MTKNYDPWYSPIIAPSGNTVSGSAALNVRIKASGGMQQLVTDVVSDAVSRASLAAKQAYVRGQEKDVIKFPKGRKKAVG